MFKTGRLDLVGNVGTPFVHTIDFEGFDWTGATFKLQVRDRKDGGNLRADLGTVASVGTEGVTLVDVATVEGVATTTISIRINEPTLEAMADAATEAGEDANIFWDIHITPSGGVKFRALEGFFVVHQGVTE